MLPFVLLSLCFTQFSNVKWTIKKLQSWIYMLLNSYTWHKILQRICSSSMCCRHLKSCIIFIVPKRNYTRLRWTLTDMWPIQISSCHISTYGLAPSCVSLGVPSFKPFLGLSYMWKNNRPFPINHTVWCCSSGYSIHLQQNEYDGFLLQSQSIYLCTQLYIVWFLKIFKTCKDC